MLLHTPREATTMVEQTALIGAMTTCVKVERAKRTRPIGDRTRESGGKRDSTL